VGPSILSNGYRGLFLGCKAVSDHLPPPSAEVTSYHGLMLRNWLSTRKSLEGPNSTWEEAINYDHIERKNGPFQLYSEAIQFTDICCVRYILFVMSMNKTFMSVAEEHNDLQSVQMTQPENAYIALEYTGPLFISSPDTTSGLKHRCLLFYKLQSLLRRSRKARLRS
jgi:hypothetical protein